MTEWDRTKRLLSVLGAFISGAALTLVVIVVVDSNYDDHHAKCVQYITLFGVQPPNDEVERAEQEFRVEAIVAQMQWETLFAMTLYNGLSSDDPEKDQQYTVAMQSAKRLRVAIILAEYFHTANRLKSFQSLEPEVPAAPPLAPRLYSANSRVPFYRGSRLFFIFD